MRSRREESLRETGVSAFSMFGSLYHVHGLVLRDLGTSISSGSETVANAQIDSIATY